MRSAGSSSEAPLGAERRVLDVLEQDLSAIMARCVLRYGASTLKLDLERLGPTQVPLLVKELERGLRLYAPDAADRCLARLRPVLESMASRGNRPKTEAGDGAGVESWQAGGTVTIRIDSEADIVLARHAGRELCARLGFSRSEEVKAATVISELARNIVLYAGKGTIALRRWTDGNRVGIEIRAKDQGPGIPNLELVLSGGYRSKTGLGLGIVGTKRLAHDFHISAAPGKGTEIVARMVTR